MLFDLYGLAAAELHNKDDVTVTKDSPNYREFPLYDGWLDRFSRRNVWVMSNFENACVHRNNSCAYKIHGTRHNRYSFTWINGMNNSPEDSYQTAKSIQEDLGGYQMDCIYNATHGPKTDLLECFLGTIFRVATAPAVLLANQWATTLMQDPDRRIIHFALSQGCIHSNLAASLLPKRMGKRINAVGVEPGEYLDESLFQSVKHIRSTRDPIASRQLHKLILNRHNTSVVSPADDELWRVFIHSVDNNGIKNALQDIIYEQKKEYEF